MPKPAVLIAATCAFLAPVFVVLAMSGSVSVGGASASKKTLLYFYTPS